MCKYAVSCDASDRAEDQPLTMKLLRSVVTHSEVVALGYLLLPVLIFLLTWLRAPYNAVCFTLTLLCYAGIVRKSIASKRGEKVQISSHIWVWIGFCIILTVLSGAGGVVWQKPDWAKHNVILNDLIDYPWPVYYGQSSMVPDTTLVYYLAYYLPAALVGKLIGWQGGQWALGVWTGIGLLLLACLVGTRGRWTPQQFTLFFLMSGADIAGILATQIFSPYSLPFPQLEQYANGLQFSSIMTQLMWVPQHAIAGWLAVSMLYRSDRTVRVDHTTSLTTAVLWYWSPFVAIGYILIIAPYILRNLHRMWSMHTVWSVVLTIIVVWFYQSAVTSGRGQWDFYLTSGPDILGNVGLLTASLIIDIMIPCILAALMWHALHREERRMLLWSVFVLVTVSMIRYGKGPDFVMRASIPALTILFMTLVTHWRTLFSQGRHTAILASAVLILGICTPLTEIATTFITHAPTVNKEPRDPMPLSYTRYKVLYTQYLGSSSHSWGTYIGNYPRTHE